MPQMTQFSASARPEKVPVTRRELYTGSGVRAPGRGQRVFRFPGPIYDPQGFDEGWGWEEALLEGEGAGPQGDLSAVDLRAWLGRCDQLVKVKGMFLHPGQIQTDRRVGRMGGPGNPPGRRKGDRGPSEVGLRTGRAISLPPGEPR